MSENEKAAGKDLRLRYHKKQAEFLFDSARIKIVAKGRRFGFTRGLANYVIERMINGCESVLWVDTTYSNIQRYVERYFMPNLKKLPRGGFKYNQQRSELKIKSSVLDLRSADRPENIEGFGYHLIVLNEAGIILNNERLWTESIRPMAMDHGAEIIIGGTPKGKRNKKREEHLFYKLFKRAEEKQENNLTNSQAEGKDQKSDWRAFNYSSYDNDKISKINIDEYVQEISPSLRDQEIFGKFVDYDTDTIIKKEWWKFFDEADLYTKRVYGVYQSWDTAFKTNEENDFSVCTTWIVTEDGYYIIHTIHERLEFPELKRRLISAAEKYKPKEILIEDHASGQSLIQELSRNTRLPIKAIKKDKDKVTYVHAVTPLIESGKVLLNKAEAQVNETIINECEGFPGSEFDDIVDSISQFLNYIKDKVFKPAAEVKTKKRIRKKFY